LGELSVTTDADEVVIFDPNGGNLPELSGQISDCPFDIQCGGVKSMQQEAVALWKVILVNKVAGGVYDSKINSVINGGYDFARLKDTDGSMAFLNY